MDAQKYMNALIQNIGQVILDKEAEITQLVCAWIAGGHVLLEDVPGTGKTILARSLAKSVQVPFKRIQFTPDLLPTDVVGVNMFNRKTQEFDFKAGPIFSTVFLADEINRATPRTQSALLEAMAEKQVTIDGLTYPLDDLFFVIATANPVGQAGTFTLPEAQLDRFFVRMSLGYPGEVSEKKIIRAQQSGHPLDELKPVFTQDHIAKLRSVVGQVQVHDPILDYAYAIVKATRENSNLMLGASPRASLALIKMAQALAMVYGQEFVSPDYIQALAVPVIAHRLVLTPEARFSGLNAETILGDILQQVTVPVGFDGKAA